MRQLIAVLLLLTPGFAAAQSARPPADPAESSTLPGIGLPLAPIGLPLPPLGLAPETPTPTQWQPSAPAPATGVEREGGGRRRGRTAATVVYVMPADGWGTTTSARVPGIVTSAATVAPAASTPAPPVDAPAVPAATGTLRLDLQPRPTGQLFVDGVYVGTLDDLGTDLTFVTGTRRLEIRERGYEPFTLAVRIDVGRTLVYRGALTRETPLVLPAAPPSAAPPSPGPTIAPAAPTSPIARKLFYFIPGCYLGDVAPKHAGLPATCDLSRVVTFQP